MKYPFPTGYKFEIDLAEFILAFYSGPSSLVFFGHLEATCFCLSTERHGPSCLCSQSNRYQGKYFHDGVSWKASYGEVEEELLLNILGPR